MRILVTGAGGFIGSHLTERLIRDGHDVKAFAHYCGRDTYGWLDDIDGCERMRGDVRDPVAIRQHVRGCDRVYHLAALGSVPYSFDAAHSFVETNTLGTLNVALACVHHGAELVHTSTSEVYGTAQTVLQDESHPLNPQSPYAASKVGADAMVKALCYSHGLHAVILRPFNTYGPRQSARAVIPRIILGGSIGDASPKRDWTYVNDTVDAFIAVEPTVNCDVFNAGTGIAVSVGDVAVMLSRVPKTHSDQLRPLTAEVKCLRADSTRIRRSTGWIPKIYLADGLKRTSEWFSGRRFIENVV